MSKHEVISGAYFPVFGLNTGKYGPEITSYLNTSRSVEYISDVRGKKLTKFSLNKQKLAPDNQQWYHKMDIQSYINAYKGFLRYPQRRQMNVLSDSNLDSVSI